MRGKRNSLRVVMRPAGRTSQLHMLFTGLPVYPVLLTGLALLLCQWFPTETLPWWGLTLVLLAVTVLGRNKLNMYYGDQIFQLKGSKRFNAVKYVHLFHRYKNLKRGNGDEQFLGL